MGNVSSLNMAGPLPTSLLSDTATLDHQGGLWVGGVQLEALAAEFGTPLFVYDETHLRSRCREALKVFGEGVAYAAKAFLCKAMARLVEEEGLRLDVATGGELYLALHAGFPPDRIIFHGNNKSQEELRQSLAAGVGRVVIDSFDELDRLQSELTRPQLVWIRVTPGIEAHTHTHVRTGGEDSKFGFGLAGGAAAEAVERIQRTPRLTLVGLHMHIGSQIFETAPFEQAVAVLADFFLSLDLTELCIGGGLGVAYVEGEVAPSITEWGRRVKAAARDAGIPESVRISAEPGRAVVAAAALTLYRVGTQKSLPGIRTYVAVDGGMSDNPRPVLYGSGYEAFLPRAAGAQRELSARVVGKHCESGDIVVQDAWLPGDVMRGDLLATPVTGAYGYAMSSTYNKVPRAAVVFVADGEAHLVVRRETYEDLLELDL